MSRTVSAKEQYFSLTTNQRMVLSTMTFQPFAYSSKEKGLFIFSLPVVSMQPSIYTNTGRNLGFLTKLISLYRFYIRISSQRRLRNISKFQTVARRLVLVALYYLMISWYTLRVCTIHKRIVVCKFLSYCMQTAR
jgi:hypothetical protein